MNRLTTALALLAVLAAAVALGVSGFSSATFVQSSSNPGSVRAASDWTPPSVTLASPAAAVSDTVTLTATATDSGSGVASVEIQYKQSSGNDWLTLCTDTTSPYSCSWSTRAVADGQYDLRARATDKAGYTTTSDTVRTTVANSVSVVLTNPGDVVRGSVPLTATIYSGAALTWSVTFEYSVAGSGKWSTACVGGGLVGGSFGCTWGTATGVTSGDYDLRAVARTTLGSTYVSNVVADVQVDNTVPMVTMTDPGSPLRGAVTFVATGTDAHSGVAKVEIQYVRSPGTTYQSLCTITTEPFSCRVSTTTLPDGTYSFRAIATDVAGNSATSTAVANRVVDNTVSSVSVEDPGAFLTGTVALHATANSTAGVGSVRIQVAPGGSTTWTDLCTDTTSPYSCTWDTRTVADGLYDLRAVLTDGSGRTTTSAVVGGRRVDNSPLRGVDVQATNGTGVVGHVDAGDTVTFTYSQAVTPASISGGWNGAAVGTTVRLRDGNTVGTGNRGDTLDVLVGGTVVNLGSVNLREDYLKSGRTVTFAATMTATTVTVGGVDRTVVTVRLGARASGTASSLRTVSVAATTVWTPSASARTPDGKTCSAAPVTEAGSVDRDF